MRNKVLSQLITSLLTTLKLLVFISSIGLINPTQGQISSSDFEDPEEDGYPDTHASGTTFTHRYDLSYQQPGTNIQRISCAWYKLNLVVSDQKKYSSISVYSELSEPSSPPSHWWQQDPASESGYQACLEAGRKHTLSLYAPGKAYLDWFWIWIFPIPYLATHPDINEILQEIDVAGFEPNQMLTSNPSLTNIDSDRGLEPLHYEQEEKTVYLKKDIDPGQVYAPERILDGLIGEDDSANGGEALIRLDLENDKQNINIFVGDVVGQWSDAKDDLIVLAPESCEGFLYTNETLEDAIDSGNLPLDRSYADKVITLCTSPSPFTATHISLEHSFIGDLNGNNETTWIPLALYSGSKFKLKYLKVFAKRHGGPSTFFITRDITESVQEKDQGCDVHQYSDACKALTANHVISYIAPNKPAEDIDGRNLKLLISAFNKDNKAFFYTYSRGDTGYSLERVDPDHIIDIQSDGAFTQSAHREQTHLYNHKIPEIARCNNFLNLLANGNETRIAILNGCLVDGPYDYNLDNRPEILIRPLNKSNEPILRLHWNDNEKTFHENPSF